MYMVVWLRRALDELANLWMNADPALRKEMTAAADRIDQTLLKNPEKQGESRADGERVLFDSPMAVLFHVKQGAVSIFHVWDRRPRKHRRR